ncbi:hypothetical protein AHAS_Ahas06G0185800 [Arachis hypogaea]
MESASRRSGGGIFEALYKVLMRRNSVYVTFVIAGAFVGERAVDYGVHKLWEHNNVGKRYEDISVLGQRQSEEGSLNVRDLLFDNWFCPNSIVVVFYIAIGASIPPLLNVVVVLPRSFICRDETDTERVHGSLTEYLSPASSLYETIHVARYEDSEAIIRNYCFTMNEALQLQPPTALGFSVTCK